MTQIAATTTASAGKTGLTGKTGAAAKGDLSLDFAALVAGLDAGTGDGTESTDALATDADADKGKGTGKEKGEGKDGKGLVLDLSLGTAAQNAMAGTVVPVVVAPVTLPTAVPADAKTATAVPVVTAPVATTMPAAVTQVATTKDQPAVLDNTGTVKQGKKVADPAATDVATAAPTPTSDDPTASLAVQQQPTLPAQASVDAPRPARQQRADKANAQSVATQRPAATTVANQAAPVVPVTQAAAQSNESQPIPVAAVPAPASTTATVPVATTEAVVQTVPPAVAQGTTPPTTVSTLRARTPVRQDDKVQAPAQPVAGEVPARQAQGQQEDGKADSDASGQQANLTAPADSASSAADASSSTARDSFADIVQSLPPIVQNRIGGVADTTVASVQASTGVGAALSNQVIDMGVGGQWIDRMAKEITALASGDGNSRFQLNPPNLGRIQVDIQQGQEGSSVQITTETDEAAKRLRDGQSSLQADARMASLSLTSISIDKAPGGNLDSGRDQSNQNPTPRHQHNGGDMGAQTSTGQNDGNRSQNSAANAFGAQTGGQQSGNNGSQPKSPWRRDVLNHQQDTQAQQGMAAQADGDRVVRYA